ncbi:MAG: sulfotransferase [Acidobacteria bacterium]|nr:sulfotransferase [Acidobacteriota bacterium]
MKSRFRRLLYGRPIVVVSGLPRSGTSMTMKMLEAGGLELVQDGVRSADEDNPKGYYEDQRVMKLHDMTDKSWLKATRGKGVKIVSNLLRSLPADNNYRVLFIRRDIQEILASQAKMLERRGEDSATDDQRMAELFAADVWRAQYLLERQPQFEWIEVNYREVLADPGRHARRIQTFLGLDLAVDRMAEVVDPSLYRNRAADNANP